MGRLLRYRLSVWLPLNNPTVVVRSTAPSIFAGLVNGRSSSSILAQNNEIQRDIDSLGAQNLEANSDHCAESTGELSTCGCTQILYITQANSETLDDVARICDGTDVGSAIFARLKHEKGETFDDQCCNSMVLGVN